MERERRKKGAKRKEREREMVMGIKGILNKKIKMFKNWKINCGSKFSFVSM